MTVQAAGSSSLEKELEYRKKLTSITNQINAAESIGRSTTEWNYLGP